MNRCWCKIGSSHSSCLRPHHQHRADSFRSIANQFHSRRNYIHHLPCY
jgi:hypothetical protein